MSNPYESIVANLENNSFVIFADASGARICAKLRGATAMDMGLMLGAAKASLERQISTLRDHIERQAGEEGAAVFDAAIFVGQTKVPYEEGLMLREVPKPQPET